MTKPWSFDEIGAANCFNPPLHGSGAFNSGSLRSGAEITLSLQGGRGGEKKDEIQAFQVRWGVASSPLPAHNCFPPNFLGFYL